jgi:PTS system D-glucosamine-specific IIC component
MNETIDYLNNNPYIYAIIVLVIILIVIGIMNFRKAINKETNFEELKNLDFDIRDLEKYVGGLDNISSVEGTISKVSFKLKDTKLVDVDKVKDLGASGIVETSSGFTFIFGSVSKTIATIIHQDLESN